MFLASASLLLGKAGTMGRGVVEVSDPVLLIAGFTLLTASMVLLAFGMKFDEMNTRTYQVYLAHKASESSDTLENKKNSKKIWLPDRLLFMAVSWAEKRRDQETATHWICLLYFLDVLIFLPALVAVLLAVIMAWIEIREAYGILSAFAVVAMLCLAVYAWKFRKFNEYFSSLISASKGMNNENYDARMTVKRFILIVVSILLIVALMEILAAKFTLAPAENKSLITNDVILGTWTDIKNDGTHSSITFGGYNNFTWSDPLVYSRTGFISGRWNNTGDKTHLTYQLTYTDPSTGQGSMVNITLTRAYYHQYGNLVTCYPYFYVDGIPDGGPFGNSGAPQISVADRPTPIPASSPAPGQDAIVGTWKNDKMQEYYMFWTFDRDGTFRSSSGGVLDFTGKWKDIGSGRYTVIYPDNTGMYIDYNNEKIFNEHAPDLTSSRVSYDVLDLY